ncbi:MAG TPA: murein biosynthesis integral membrane protein MurJ [Patescibacteria group bacterium]|nr:murein biosynthesis integral membrane protein MurJ [Patescibacteria group bacterium]
MQQDQPPKPKKRIPLSNVALLLIGSALVSQLLGFLRTKLVNANFSAVGPHSTDAYFAAFNIPDFFFYTIAAGVLGVAFIPVLADRLQKGDRRGMWEISSSLLNLLCMLMFAVAIVIFIFAEPLIHYVVAPNLDHTQLHNAAVIMRFLALNPLFFTLSGILTSVQQTLGRFFFYAIAPLFYNVAIILSIYVFKGTSFGLKGLGIGALVGGIVQLGVVCLGLIGTRFRWQPKIMWRSEDFRMVLRQLPPRSLDQGMDQLQTIVETNFARRLGEGNISYFNNASTLQAAPTLLIGTAISTAAFPRLAARLSQGRPDLFRRDFLRILRFMVWITIPVVIVSFFARGYLAHLIFSQNAPQIALIFGYLTLAIFFRTLYTIISRWFYARKDTKTPLFVSIFTITLNIVLAAILARPSTYQIVGLALSSSLASMAEVLVLSAIMVYRDRGLLNMAFWGGISRAVSVGGFSMVAAYLTVSLFPLGAADRGFVTLGTKLLAVALVTFTVHVSISGLFGLDEARPVFTWIKHRLAFRPVRQGGPFSQQ